MAIDVRNDIKTHPLKASLYGLGITTLCYFSYKNPSEEQFHHQLVENMDELLTVGPSIRNPKTNEHFQMLLQQKNCNLLKRFSFGIFSVMWTDNFGNEVDLYEAHCKYLKVGWLDWKDRIVDVGILGRWRNLDKMMIDYDINSSEWENK